MLKPLSSAISIGSGGPFGAEGPIIMTGGACGSLIAQFFQLTAAERKTLLVAGAAARDVGDLRGAGRGGAARRRTAAVRVEAAQLHPGGAGQRGGGRRAPLPARRRPAVPGAAAPDLHRPVRLARLRRRRPAGGRAVGGADATRVYASEDAFEKLPIHWMWWPAIGGLVIGIGGYCLSAGARRRLRHDRRTCCRATSPAASSSASCSSSRRSGRCRSVRAPPAACSRRC